MLFIIGNYCQVGFIRSHFAGIIFLAERSAIPGACNIGDWAESSSVAEFLNSGNSVERKSTSRNRRQQYRVISLAA